MRPGLIPLWLVLSCASEKPLVCDDESIATVLQCVAVDPTDTDTDTDTDTETATGTETGGQGTLSTSTGS